jgi:hypothetical protein
VRRPSRQCFGFRVAASSGPIHKAPGSAGGYLPVSGRVQRFLAEGCRKDNKKWHLESSLFKASIIDLNSQKKPISKRPCCVGARSCQACLRSFSQVSIGVAFDPPYCLVCRCYPDGAVADDDPMPIDWPRRVAFPACSTRGAVGGSGPT